MRFQSLSAVVLVTALGCGHAFGASSVFLASGVDPSNHANTATAQFTSSANQLSITLTNTTPITYGAIDLLTALKFTVANFTTTTPTLISGSAIARTVGGSGTFTDSGSAANLKALNTWETSVSAGTYKIDFNPDLKYAIIGAAEASGGTKYSAADPSIKGNNGDNPFSALTATFVVGIPGLTADSTISSATFSFGTNYDTSIAGTLDGRAGGPAPVGVTLPSSVSGGLVLLGLMGGAALIRRRKWATAAA